MRGKFIKIGAVAVAMLIMAAASGCGKQNSNNSTDNSSVQSTSTSGQAGDAKKNEKTVDVSIKTDKGEIVLELRPDLMPITVENFMKLVDKGFYNGLKFHRVEDWVIQGGDPEGTGRGGPGWSIKLETSPELTHVKYAVGMARSSAPDSAGSQFYILKKDSHGLDGQYAIFGTVIKGQDVVDKIAIGDKMTEVKRVNK